MGKRIGEDDNYHVRVSAMKMKKMKAIVMMTEARFCFKTMSDVDVLDDGYKWRKLSGSVRLGLLCYFLIVMMARAQSIEVQDWNAFFRFTMNLMNNEQRLMKMMLQYVGWNNFVLSLMTLTNESLNDRYPNAEVVWCQEEPMNMGGSYVLPRLISSMKAVNRKGYDDVKYIGGAPFAATTTGFLKIHQK
ncbi:hypothetical protein JHK86_001277 [Glycine max]|nr:hypothetical protein JHK86_001277 [Glycine max]